MYNVHMDSGLRLESRLYERPVHLQSACTASLVIAKDVLIVKTPKTESCRYLKGLVRSILGYSTFKLGEQQSFIGKTTGT